MRKVLLSLLIFLSICYAEEEPQPLSNLIQVMSTFDTFTEEQKTLRMKNYKERIWQTEEKVYDEFSGITNQTIKKYYPSLYYYFAGFDKNLAIFYLKSDYESMYIKTIYIALDKEDKVYTSQSSLDGGFKFLGFKTINTFNGKKQAIYLKQIHTINLQHLIDDE